VALGVLNSTGIRFETVDLMDYESGWETGLIKRYNVDVWINDRLDTDYRHSKNVKRNNIRLITFDDNGSGTELSDLHVAALAFAKDGKSKAKKTLKGIEYLILNKDIDKFKRLRDKKSKIIVTLGGSDTYGVTVKVVNLLKEQGKTADIHVGPSFKHHEELKAIIDERYRVIGRVPSLIKTFYDYDLAVTGGGITPFEANASGLPCIIVANELFEIANGQFLSNIGSSIYAGFHENIDKTAFARPLEIETMSRSGMTRITLNGAENIYRQIEAL
jgi:spore coat polysaccharide biosynthesis predicted glycosyltransferase SpsG